VAIELAASWAQECLIQEIASRIQQDWVFDLVSRFPFIFTKAWKRTGNPFFSWCLPVLMIGLTRLVYQRSIQDRI
jgi:hypothetical protein